MSLDLSMIEDAPAVDEKDKELRDDMFCLEVATMKDAPAVDGKDNELQGDTLDVSFSLEDAPAVDEKDIDLHGDTLTLDVSSSLEDAPVVDDKDNELQRKISLDLSTIEDAPAVDEKDNKLHDKILHDVPCIEKAPSVKKQTDFFQDESSMPSSPEITSTPISGSPTKNPTVPYFYLPKPNLDDFLKETGERLNVAEIKTSACQEKTFETKNTGDIVFKIKSDSENNHDENSRSSSISQKMKEINSIQDQTPGKKRCLLKQCLLKEIAQKKLSTYNKKQEYEKLNEDELVFKPDNNTPVDDSEKNDLFHREEDKLSKFNKKQEDEKFGDLEDELDFEPDSNTPINDPEENSDFFHREEESANSSRLNDTSELPDNSHEFVSKSKKPTKQSNNIVCPIDADNKSVTDDESSEIEVVDDDDVQFLRSVKKKSKVLDSDSDDCEIVLEKSKSDIKPLEDDSDSILYLSESQPSPSKSKEKDTCDKDTKDGCPESSNFEISSSIPCFQPHGGFLSEFHVEDPVDIDPVAAAESKIMNVPKKYPISRDARELSEDSNSSSESSISKKTKCTDTEKFGFTFDNPPVSPKENGAVFSSQDIENVCSGVFKSDISQERRSKDCDNDDEEIESEDSIKDDDKKIKDSNENEDKESEDDDKKGESDEDEDKESEDDDKKGESDEDKDKESEDDDKKGESDEDEDKESVYDEDEDKENNKMSRISKSNESGEIAKEFVIEEAELSGNDSDHEDDNEEESDGSHQILDLIQDDTPVSEELREDVASYFMKQQRDQDYMELNIIQEQILKDTDTVGNEREKKYTWKNKSNEESASGSKVISSDESEDDYSNWSDINKEKVKFLHEKDDVQLDDVQFKRSKKMKQQILGKPEFVKESESLKQNMSFKRSRNSYLCLDDESSSQIVKKLKLTDDVITGSRTTKHILFQAPIDGTAAKESIDKNDSNNQAATSVFKQL